MAETKSTIKKSIEIKGFNGLCTVEQWTPESALEIFQTMEVYNWAPWLAASPESLIGRACTFPEGQLLLRGPNNETLASLSTNRIWWDGNVDTLPSWDQVAGEPTTYQQTYDCNGNALVLMSMNVNPKYTKSGLATLLVGEVQGLAKNLGITYLMGSFRPSQFGHYKVNYGSISFEEYIYKERGDDNLPIDAWIRSLTRNGMKPLKIDHQAMVVTISCDQFETLKKESWVEVQPDCWECDQVGQWSVNRKQESATYTESNLWGILPGTPGYKKFI